MRRTAALLAVLLVGTAHGEPSFSDWLDAAPGRRAEVAGFERYLAAAGVGGVLASPDLLRNASS